MKWADQKGPANLQFLFSRNDINEATNLLFKNEVEAQIDKGSTVYEKKAEESTCLDV